MKSLSFLALCVVICAKAGQPSALKSADQPTRTKALNVYEAVIRYQIHSWELAADSYCIQINGRDADKELLHRLAPLPVKGRSGCKKHTPESIKPIPMMSVIDKKTKKNSVIFYLGDISWRGDAEIEVPGGYDCASQCWASGVYHAVLDASGWRVIRFDLHSIS
jgi:hypothetical protein